MSDLPPPRSSFPWALYVPGGIVLTMGILILVFPDLLALLFAALLIMLGVSLLGIADYGRRSGRGSGAGYRQVITILRERPNPFDRTGS